MITIYAQTFLNATRNGQIRVEDLPSAAERKRRYWFKRRKTRLITPTKL